ncbi:MAG: acyloxyacyl hydrolase, partial [Rhodospirillaceae bacterium]|nr:acyloxyacyl hydrolase [Rhodospirillaceae bacterium]
YRFSDRSRLGVALSHISNASIGDKNPGAESLMLTYALPVRNLFGD